PASSIIKCLNCVLVGLYCIIKKSILISIIILIALDSCKQHVLAWNRELMHLSPVAMLLYSLFQKLEVIQHIMPVKLHLVNYFNRLIFCFSTFKTAHIFCFKFFNTMQT